MPETIILYKFAMPCPQCGPSEARELFSEEYYELSKPLRAFKNPNCRLCGDSGLVLIRKMVPPLEELEGKCARIVIEWI